MSFYSVFFFMFTNQNLSTFSRILDWSFWLQMKFSEEYIDELEASGLMDWTSKLILTLLTFSKHFAALGSPPTCCIFVLRWSRSIFKAWLRTLHFQHQMEVPLLLLLTWSTLSIYLSGPWWSSYAGCSLWWWTAPVNRLRREPASW